MNKVLFIGEYASRNIGDGVIRLAIEKLCRDHAVQADFGDFYGGTAAASATPAIPAIPAIPAAPTAPSATAGRAPGAGLRQWLLRSRAINYAIAFLFYLGRYRRTAANYQVRRYTRVVVGGGNLLMDNFLNFPLLILRVVQECERHEVPLTLFSVGAGQRHSWLARRIIARILRSPAVQGVICRDGHSYALIRDAAQEDGPQSEGKIMCGFDSALYLARQDAPPRPTATVGLGVIAPDVLRAVAPWHPMAQPRQAMQWWEAVADALAKRIGAENIELLSNGSGMDDAFAQALWDRLAPRHPGLSVCTSIRSPDDLLRKIGSYRALAAYRMHAAVVAMALDVPVIGFEWDPKVLQLFTYCGKPEACVAAGQFAQSAPQSIVASLLEATPARLTPIRQILARDFLHAVGRQRNTAFIHQHGRAA